jgi:hypothetical protein
MQFIIRSTSKPATVTGLFAHFTALALLVVALSALVMASPVPAPTPAAPVTTAAPAPTAAPVVIPDAPLYELDGRDDGYLGSYGG